MNQVQAGSEDQFGLFSLAVFVWRLRLTPCTKWHEAWKLVGPVVYDGSKLPGFVATFLWEL